MMLKGGLPYDSALPYEYPSFGELRCVSKRKRIGKAYHECCHFGMVSLSIHLDEALLIELRERQQTLQGRARLRERVSVEHSLAHVGRWQGRRARYRGVRKNLFDLRCCAVVHNLHVLARSQQKAAKIQAVA